MKELRLVCSQQESNDNNCRQQLFSQHHETTAACWFLVIGLYRAKGIKRGESSTKFSSHNF
jgi:hypothetical protein